MNAIHSTCSVVEALRSVSGLKAERLKAVHTALLEGRTWRYLRYLHARCALSAAQDVSSVLVVGAGHGLAELALAVEHPEVNFVLTDWSGASHSVRRARAWVEE